jgi:hypothetical protein
MRHTMKKLWLRRTVIGLSLIGLGVLLSFAFFMQWVKRYPMDYDPKNIDYVLWKHRLNQNMNLDHALGAMTHDTWAVNLVKGLSKEELKDRFGNIRTLSEARPYDQYCNTINAVGELGIHPAGKEVVFLRDSDWMVILDDGKAVDLVLCKGY